MSIKSHLFYNYSSVSNLQKKVHVARFLPTLFIWLHNLSNNINLEKKSSVDPFLQKTHTRNFLYHIPNLRGNWRIQLIRENCTYKVPDCEQFTALVSLETRLASKYIDILINWKRRSHGGTRWLTWKVFKDFVITSFGVRY